MLLHAFVMISCSALLADDDVKIIKPADAAKHVGDICTVQFHVNSTAKDPKGRIVLNSEEKAASAKNFTVGITRSGIANFKKAMIDDPSTHFKGKTIQATGLIRVVNKRYEIVIDDPEMIKVLEKK